MFTDQCRRSDCFIRMNRDPPTSSWQAIDWCLITVCLFHAVYSGEQNYTLELLFLGSIYIHVHSMRRVEWHGVCRAGSRSRQEFVFSHDTHFKVPGHHDTMQLRHYSHTLFESNNLQNYNDQTKLYHSVKTTVPQKRTNRSMLRYNSCRNRVKKPQAESNFQRQVRRNKQQIKRKARSLNCTLQEDSFQKVHQKKTRNI